MKKKIHKNNVVDEVHENMKMFDRAYDLGVKHGRVLEKIEMSNKYVKKLEEAVKRLRS